MEATWGHITHQLHTHFWVDMVNTGNCPSGSWYSVCVNFSCSFCLKFTQWIDGFGNKTLQELKSSVTTAPTQHCGNKWAFLYLYMFYPKHTSETLWWCMLRKTSILPCVRERIERRFWFTLSKSLSPQGGHTRAPNWSLQHFWDWVCLKLAHSNDVFSFQCYKN